MHTSSPHGPARWLIALAALSCVAGLFFNTPQERFLAALVGAAAPIAAYYLAKLSWLAAVKARHRNWLQYNLRGLLILIVVCAVGLWAWDRLFRPGHEQRRLIDAVSTRGGGGASIDPQSRVDISTVGTTDDDLAYLASLPGRRSVVQMSLTYSKITDEGMAHLSKFPELECLAIRGCQITNVGFAKLKMLPKLRNLHVTECPNITDDGVGWLAERRQLRTINLMYTPVTPAKLKELREALPYCDIVLNHP